MFDKVKRQYVTYVAMEIDRPAKAPLFVVKQYWNGVVQPVTFSGNDVETLLREAETWYQTQILAEMERRERRAKLGNRISEQWEARRNAGKE